MKTDDFENELARRPMREVPVEWRDSILNRARNEASHAALLSRPSRGSFWRGLLWPCPQAWAGLAAAWGVIFLLYSEEGSQRPQTAQITPPANANAILVAVQERRRLLMELTAFPDAPAQVKNPDPPKPRGQAPGHSAAG